MPTRSGSLKGLGGYPDVPIYETVELLERIRAASMAGGGRIVTLPSCVSTSPRRWERNSVWRSTLMDISLYTRYQWGATCEQIFERYYGEPPA